MSQLTPATIILEQQTSRAAGGRHTSEQPEPLTAAEFKSGEERTRTEAVSAQGGFASLTANGSHQAEEDELDLEVFHDLSCLRVNILTP